MLKVIISLALLFAYASATLLINPNQANAILAIGIIMLFVFWVLIKDIKLDFFVLILLICSFIVIILTFKVNLISLSLLLVISNVAYFEGRKVDKWLLKYYLKFNLTLFVIVALLYFLTGFNASFDINMWRIDEIIHRRSLGFSQPNQATMLWLGCALCVLSFANKKNTFKIALITLVASLLIYYFTQSRTSTYIIILLCIYVMLFRKSMDKVVSKAGRLFISIYPLICLVFSYLLLVVPYNPKIDSFFSGRMLLYKSFYQTYGISLFGNKALENAMFDNSYLQSLLSKGIIFTSLLSLTFFILLVRLRKMTRNDTIIIFGFFTCALAETMLFKFELLLLVILIMYRHNYRNDGLKMEDMTKQQNPVT